MIQSHEDIANKYDVLIETKQQDIQKAADLTDYMHSIGELKGEQVKLCDYLDDPKSQRILAEHFINYDEDSKNFGFIDANLKNADDLLLYYKVFVEDKNNKFWIIKDLNNNPVGTIFLQLWKPLDGVNIGCNIASKYWGNGYALDASKTIMQKFYEDKITAKFFVGAEAENGKSLRALEKGAKAFGFENFSRKDKSKIFMTPNYKLEQKEVKFEISYKVDDKNSDYVNSSLNIFGNHIGDWKFLKKLIKPEFIETGYFEPVCQYMFITPIFN